MALRRPQIPRLKLGHYPAEDFRSALRARPGDHAALFGLVRALTALGDAAAARRLLDEHLIGSPGDAEALRLREGMK